MNKKEEIQYLRIKNKRLKGSLLLAVEALNPIKRQSIQRGARMQILMKHIKEGYSSADLDYPREFDRWFDKDGVPLI